ncbi:chorismate mutase [Rhodococcus sp. SMB37]|uniref:chorismate mutase n=1 Tax=Rhodococcus sp. SMB37 TaxID=2512213 RepID=UPI00104A32D4|nr:chorismate mutase [Rhodococcus sp. SMB37]TCN52664.1 chorismate mutase [Rhodococcus sp. SMB37]
MSTNIDASLTGGAAASNGAAVSNGTAADPVPTTEAEIDELRQEIDRLDAEILAAVKRRAEVSRLIGRTRMASGGTRLVHSREMKVLERFSELGQEGHTLAMLLLRLGRGRLGH